MEKIKVTAQQRANAVEALTVMWPSVPAANVAHKLSTWRAYNEERNGPPTCGTHACFGGWCAWWPSFRTQGVTSDSTGAPVMGRAIDGGVARKLFGAKFLFDYRSFLRAHRADHNTELLTDHELVTHRLQWLIDNSEVIA